MENSEKLFELLSKDILNEDDHKELQQLLKDDPECVELYNLHEKLSGTAKNYSHLSTDELSEYVLFKNGPAETGENIIVKASLIEKHLRTCKKCEAEFIEINSEYNGTKEFLDSAFANSEGHNIIPERRFRQPLRYRYIYSAAAIVIFIILSTAAISILTRPAYYALAKLPAEPGFSTTRGRATDYFQKGLQAYENGNYDKSIEYIKSDIQANSNESTIFYSYYILGLINLEHSQKNTLGLFPHYDKNNVNNSISYFKLCILLNKGSEFPDISLNSYYYIAKAYLMLGNKNEAAVCLKKVINGKGSKMEDAADILSKLE